MSEHPSARSESASAREQQHFSTADRSNVPTAPTQLAVSSLEQPAEPWLALRRATPARIALGRVGASMPTAEVLAFSMAHAQARDAVHLPLDVPSLHASLHAAGFRTLLARSQAETRAEYLRRPDLGRLLHSHCYTSLSSAAPPAERTLALVVADGLSSRAATAHALPMLIALRDRLGTRPGEWALDTVVVATQARVALADEIGALRGAEAVVILIGERPGLSSPSSLSLYLTYNPRPGRSDAERNCISNVRDGGLSYTEAAYKLHYLITEARAAGASGICIKDTSESAIELPRLQPALTPVSDREFDAVPPRLTT